MKTKQQGSWVIDFRHVLTDEGDLYRRNGRVPPMFQFMASIVSNMSVMDAGEIIKTATQCHKRPNRISCKEWIVARKGIEKSEIEWACPRCGYHGIIHGWQGTNWDFRDKMHGEIIQ